MTSDQPTCLVCGGPIPPKTHRGRPRRYCSEYCRQGSASRPCVDCGRVARGTRGRPASRCHVCAPAHQKRLAQERLLDRIFNKIDASGDCWEWTGWRGQDGYGRDHINRRSTLMHRWLYEQLAGPILDGLVMDHLCRNRGCVNPAHLEVVTRRENNLRGISPPALNAVKTHCTNGHPLAGPNLIVDQDGHRRCRTCRLARRRERERSLRQAA